MRLSNFSKAFLSLSGSLVCETEACVHLVSRSICGGLKKLPKRVLVNERVSLVNHKDIFSQPLLYFIWRQGSTVVKKQFLEPWLV